MRRADVAIIGGSLAGAACARELHRRGIDAVCLERDVFPRDKVCGGFLSPGAVNLLDELELLGSVRNAGASEVRFARIRMDDTESVFPFPGIGLGISRRSLDALVADHPAVRRGTVRGVDGSSGDFRVHVDQETLAARVVVDAAGKFSRWTKRQVSPQYGIQFYLPESRGDVMDFWFFEDGYGGAVTIEGGRSNACFLIEKSALPRYLREGTQVTGPIAYECRPGPFLSIGDAGGMMDPFCGEGMRQALDTGMIAARVIADGFDRGMGFEGILLRYREECGKRWARKRRRGRLLRRILRHPSLARSAFRLNPDYWLAKLWE